MSNSFFRVPGSCILWMHLLLYLPTQWTGPEHSQLKLIFFCPHIMNTPSAPCIGHDRGNFINVHEQRRSGAGDCASYNDILMLLPESIKLESPSKPKKGDLTADRSGQVPRSKSTLWLKSSVKIRGPTIGSQPPGLWFRQFYTESMVATSHAVTPEQKSSSFGVLSWKGECKCADTDGASFGTHVGRDATLVEAAAKRCHKAPSKVK